ncbi:hypothetical protein Drose_05820 [Dactylosporangium roseum]|uniref:SF3 helicase domain-containing protein n=1 Tax=Dactylosporangium roseum TaxID=47989 RepID=A0ABY5ZAR5_9ACTN|nr:phage/plasmid primase, P4 family [Dactylosporangium roseum]UWZ37788.1 hypothetical protein Drose_05820 [Dactylosporangium roseum]
MTDEAPTILVVEGVEQAKVAEECAPPGVQVLGVAGCRSWATSDSPPEDLSAVEGKPVVVAFAMDVAGDPQAHQAATALTDALMADGASSVRYLSLPGRARLATVLTSRPAERRTTYLANLIAQAKPRLPRKPSKRTDRQETAGDIGFFDHNGLLVQRLYLAIVDRYPAALTRERKVALYRSGVFHIDGTAFVGVISDLLGDRYRPGHRGAAEEFAAGQLFNISRFLPEHGDTALLNVRNGMLDLATGTLKPHDPIYLSGTQLPIEWNPDAKCPTYDRWLAEAIGDQVNDLEESTSTMLDPSRTPTKAVFLFGPSRSGKSTYLRLMQKIAGDENYSAVTLHQLSENRFAAANLYGKILNCAADLSSAHVEDMSVFKMLTGEDPVQADRKFGSQFAFVNRALFAFSANELPTVGESSSAYVERIKPFGFLKSFAGREDPTIEAKMIAEELPGILVRWVTAWQRMTARGGYLKTDPQIRREFEVRSDRVRQFVAEQCKVQAVTPDGSAVIAGTELPGSLTITKRAFAQAFNRWAEQQQAKPMGERKVIDRVTSINGVFEVRRTPGSIRALNITLRTETDEKWPTEAPDDDLAPAVPAVSERTVPNPGKTRDVEGTDGDVQGVLYLAHGGEYGDSAGTAGEQPACARCGGALVALIDVTSGYHDECPAAVEAA